MSADVSSLLTVISRVNLSSLKLLNALIITCRMNLISYSPFICRILSQTLHWISVENWPYGIGKPHKSVRVEVYNCTTNWISVSKACSGINKYMDDILSSIISDINVEPPALTLKVPTGKGKGKKHKHKKEVPFALEHIVYKEEDKDVCKAALDMIPVILSSTSTVMKPEQHKLLQEIIVSKLLRIQHSSTSDAPIPYSDGSCRLSLYKALLSLCDYYHPSFPPPNNFASTIFSKGMKDSSIEVLSFCVHALNSVGKILKPPFPSLEYQTAEEGLNYLNKDKHRGDNRSYVKNVSGRSFVNSTPKSNNFLNETESGALSGSYLEDIDSSIFNPSNEVVEKQSEIQMNIKEKVNKVAEIRSDSESYSQVDDTVSKTAEEQSKIEESIDIVSEESLSSSSACSESIRPTVIVGSEPSNNSDSHHVNEDATNREDPIIEQSNSTSETAKKRNLEGDVENSFSKKTKMNGVSEEHFLTVEDSDDEMLSSFVDEVIDE